MADETVNDEQDKHTENNTIPVPALPKYVLSGAFLPLLGTWSGTWVNEGDDHAKPAPFRFNRINNEGATPVPTISVVIPSGHTLDLPITTEWKGSFNVFLPNNKVRSFNDHATVTVENPNLPNSPDKVLLVTGHGYNSVGQYSLKGEFLIADASMRVTRLYTGPPKQREAQRSRAKSTPTPSVPNTLRELIENEVSSARMSTRASNRKNSLHSDPPNHAQTGMKSPYTSVTNAQGVAAYPSFLEGFDFSVFTATDLARGGLGRGVGNRRGSLDSVHDNLGVTPGVGNGGRQGSASLSARAHPSTPGTPYSSTRHHISLPVVPNTGLLASPLMESPLPPPIFPRLVAHQWEDYPPCSDEMGLHQAFLVQSAQLYKLFSLPWRISKEILKFYKHTDDVASPATTPLPSLNTPATPVYDQSLVSTALATPNRPATADRIAAASSGNSKDGVSASSSPHTASTSPSASQSAHEGKKEDESSHSGVPLVRGKHRFEQALRDLSMELPHIASQATNFAHVGIHTDPGNTNNANNGKYTNSHYSNNSDIVPPVGVEYGLPSPRSAAPTVAPICLGAGAVQQLQEIAQRLQQHGIKKEDEDTPSPSSSTGGAASEESLRSQRKVLLEYIQQLSARGLLFQLYTGSLLHGLPSGYGVCVYPPHSRVPNGVSLRTRNRNTAGRMYEGGWESGAPHGMGVLSNIDGDVVYMGGFSRGRFHGVGIYVYQDGTIYKGTWQDGLPHGIGCLIRSRTKKNKDSKDDEDNKKKSERTPMHVHEGGYITAKPVSKKPLVDTTSAPSTPVRKKGTKAAETHSPTSTSSPVPSASTASPDAPTLQVIFNEPLVYAGTWNQGLRHGIGIQTYSCGTVYKGHWRDGKRHGVGVTRCIFPPDVQPSESVVSSVLTSVSTTPEDVRTPTPQSPVSSHGENPPGNGAVSPGIEEEGKTVDLMNTEYRERISFLPESVNFDTFPTQTFLFSHPATSTTTPDTKQEYVLHGVYLSGHWKDGSLTHGTATLAKFQYAHPTAKPTAATPKTESNSNAQASLGDTLRTMGIHAVPGVSLFDLPSGVTVARLDRYRGEFCSGRRHGYGIYEFSSTEAIVSGLWELDQLAEALPIPVKYIPPFDIQEHAQTSGDDALHAASTPTSRSAVNSPRLPPAASPASSPRILSRTKSPALSAVPGGNGEQKHAPLNLGKPTNPAVFFPKSFVAGLGSKEDSQPNGEGSDPEFQASFGILGNRKRRRQEEQVTKERLEFCPPEEEEDILFCIPIQPTQLL